MDGVDRSAAAKIFQESLAQLQNNLQPVSDSPVSEPVSPLLPPAPNGSNRDQQLAVFADAIADLEAFLNHQHLSSPNPPKLSSLLESEPSPETS